MVVLHEHRAALTTQGLTRWKKRMSIVTAYKIVSMISLKGSVLMGTQSSMTYIGSTGQTSADTDGGLEAVHKNVDGWLRTVGRRI
jgi:hypothetical protein